MNIENLRRLINGEALNEPNVSSVIDFAFESKKVRQGFAFFGFNTTPDEIREAVENGAYAIICEDDVQVIDKEIAFIKVDSLGIALMRLIRFESSYKNLKFYLVNTVQKSILQHTTMSKNASILPNEIGELFLKIMKANSGDIFFTDETKLLSKIAPLFETVCTDINAICTSGGSIFSSSFVCDEIYYQNLNFPRVFIGYLCGLLKFLSHNKINFKLGDMKNLGHFEPIFINNAFKIMPFGASLMAFIVESDDELFDIEASFLKKNFNQDIEICTPKSMPSKYTTFYFDDLSEIKNLKSFHYALIKCQRTELEAILNTQINQKNLFDI